MSDMQVRITLPSTLIVIGLILLVLLLMAWTG